MSDKKCKTINDFYDSKRGNYISHAPPESSTWKIETSKYVFCDNVFIMNRNTQSCIATQD